MNRRKFLSRVVPAATGLALATSLPRVAAAARQKPATRELGDRLWMVTGLGGNVVVFDSPEGVLLVDGGGDGQTGELLKVVRTLTGKREVHTLFNTHWHHEQTGANTTLGPAGTRIIAHENTRLWLGTDIDSKWEKRTYTRLPKEARPTQTFYTTGSLAFGGETLDYGYQPQAHTDGDIHVHFRNANLLVAGDVVQLPSYPVIDTATNGCITGMVNGLQGLSAIGNEATRIVPARGDVVARAALKEQSDMLVAVRARLAKAIAQGKSLEEARAMNPTGEFDARWGDPGQFLINSWAGMVRRPQELGQAVV